MKRPRIIKRTARKAGPMSEAEIKKRNHVRYIHSYAASVVADLPDDPRQGRLVLACAEQLYRQCILREKPKSLPAAAPDSVRRWGAQVFGKMFSPDSLEILRLAGVFYEKMIAEAQGEAPYRWGIDR